jgi:SsrA-binding protein
MANKNKSKKTAKSSGGTGVIALNRKSSHLYHLEDRLEAGLQLTGWEVKSLRDGRAQISEAYIIIRKGQAWLLNAHFTPLTSASTHVVAVPERTRKLLLHKREINKITGKIKEVGYTVVPTKLYWKNNMVKIEIAMAKGKKDYDKRQTIKSRDWERQKGIIMKKSQNKY